MKSILAMTIAAVLLSASFSVSAQSGANAPGTGAALLEQYLAIKDALVKSDATAAKAAAGALLKVITDKQATLQPPAAAIAGSTDLAVQRKQFAQLGNALYPIVKTMHPGSPVYYQHCPMFANGKGGNWLSLEKDIRNPFYGAQMLTCGSIKDTVQ
ncbi:DUF3347 domain-containing protein [Chitinophaga horti]|uniref:DUF3347 domain-containing protein n=1 Tax=Chitinophaga horti TaxID=2920382 RepID=A0ABY6JAZ4_9BACT|nr:DUF3347 domain-containing protein [Chitinophaga horti]UYQ95349.1 DUF3347 domain-containing protein [Chitinophaga horti]